MGQDAVTVRGGYHLAVAVVDRNLAEIAKRSIVSRKYYGRRVREDEIDGLDFQSNNPTPRHVVWKVLYDDGMPLKSIARVFSRSTSGIQSGISRLNKRIPFDEQAYQLFAATQKEYHAKTHTTR